jgi:hypothetical protein
MNNRSTTFLVALAIGLLGLVFVADRAPLVRTGSLVPMGKLLPGLDASVVSEISVRGSNFVVRAVRSDGLWKLTSPDYPASQNAIGQFLGVVSELERRASVPLGSDDSDEHGLVAFGLEPPTAAVSLEIPGGAIQLDIGAETLLEGELYSRLGGEPGVQVVNDAILDFLPVAATSWRSTALLDSGTLEFDQVAITNPIGALELVVDPETQLWKMTRPIAARADLFAVNALIQTLRSARVEGFVTDDPAVAFESFGLDAPSSSLGLSRAGVPVFGIQFGRSPTNQPGQVFAQLQSRSNIVVVSAGLLEMLRRPHTTYRDHSLATVSPAAVDRVEVRTREPFVLEREPGKPWRIVEPFAAAADPEAVRSLFESVNRLRIVEFTRDIVDDFAPYGLETPDRRYSFFSRGDSQVSTNTLLARIDFSGNQIAGGRVDTVFARCQGESSVYTVPYGDTLQLPRAAYELRDKQVWRFDAAAVARCIVEQASATNVWDRTEEGVWTF